MGHVGGVRWLSTVGGPWKDEGERLATGGSAI